jgi:hypothetical protein
MVYRGSRGTNMTDPMITATQHLEASPKPSYGPHKASERYLDDEDADLAIQTLARLDKRLTETKIDDFLFVLETLRTHLRKKYYGG